MERLLIMRFSAMGDVLMTIPVIDTLAHQYPQLEIVMASRPMYAPLFACLPKNVSFVGVDLKQLAGGLRGLEALYQLLAGQNPTRVADFHDVLRTKYVRKRFFLKGIPVESIRKNRSARKAFIKAEVKQPQISVFDKYADVLRRSGYPIDLSKAVHSLFEEGKGDLSSLKLPEELLQERTSQTGRPVSRWIGIAPFAAHEGKIYPLEKMEQVVAALTRDSQNHVFFLGAGKKEMDVLKTWCEKYPQTHLVADYARGLFEELTLISHMNAVLSMDSSNMHLASLAGIPVASVWGATHPYAGFLGWGQELSRVIQVDMPCRPCSIYGNKPCRMGDYPCLRQITPQMVADKVLLLAGSSEA